LNFKNLPRPNAQLQQIYTHRRREKRVEKLLQTEKQFSVMEGNGERKKGAELWGNQRSEN
jgi:hypothetical protein